MKKITLLLVLLCMSVVVKAQQHKIPSSIKEFVKARIDTDKNVGIVVGYINGDAIEYFSYGKTALTNGTDVNENSVFEIGSISKTFTTILLSEQVLKGNMKLSDAISKYLPEGVKVPTRNGKEITLKDLATHSSGLPRMPDNFTPANPNNPFADYSVKQVYSFLSTHELSRDIGESYEYSNYGMGLLGHILELKSGKGYEALMIEKIANTYGMDDTRIVFTPAMKARLAKGHAAGREVENWDINSLAGAGGIRSTASDMVKFIKANMTAQDTPISKAMQLSHQSAYSNTAQNFEMGLGWHYASTGDNNKVIWHNGGTGGYKAFSGFIEGTQKGVVVLTNSTESIDALGLAVLDPTRKLTIPKKVEEITVAEDVLETYVGKYELTPEFHIVVTRTGQQLFVQATGQPQFEIFASAQNEFFLKVVEASVTFNKDANGKVESLTLHQGGQNVPGKKIE